MPVPTPLPRRRVAARPRKLAWALVMTVLVALNLRAAVTSLGPVLPRARTELGLGASAASFATAAPVLCFGLFALVSPWLAKRLGLDRAMALAVLVLVAGLFGRPVAGEAALLVGTVLCCIGIAVANVLLPAVVKERAPNRIGLVTGAYTAALAGGSALAAAVSAPLADSFGVRMSLWAWTAPALVALVVWVPHLWARQGPDVTPSRARSDIPEAGTASVWRSPVGWALAGLFGAQATTAYVTMGWLPTLLQHRGIGETQAGLLLAASILVSVPVSAVVPTMAARRYSQVGLITVLTMSAFLGLTGLTFAPTWASWAFAAALGIGNGVFPLTLTLFNIRGRSPSETQSLSAMGQGVGYLLAAAGPFAFGVVGSMTGDWRLPMFGLLVVVLLQVAAGLVAGRPRSRPAAPGNATVVLEAGDRAGSC
ncbi:MFS transporter [Segeticoccus rhizosphaerae]|uniref:MFS transporter n=1 Tax=Segeticoccus rhizosphaerae TaxID=1104777 RepID=UPI00139064F7|nr:MFS transporter [Ornithinicoccus soli]